jgi:hypothetical protein
METDLGNEPSAQCTFDPHRFVGDPAIAPKSASASSMLVAADVTLNNNPVSRGCLFRQVQSGAVIHRFRCILRNLP